MLVAALGVADGDKEAGSFEAEGRAVKAGCGDAGDFSAAAFGLSDGERRGMAIDKGDGGRVAVRKLDGEAQAEARAGHAQLVLAHLVEDARAIAEDDGNAGGRIPDDVAEAAQAGEVDADGVPIGMEGDVAGGSDDEEALRRLRDRAGVGDVELEGCAGGERLGERDGGLVKLAGVVDVGVERGDGVEGVVGGDANALPVERGGDLQRDVGEGGFAVVAHGDEGADGDLLLGGAQMHVHVEGGEGEGLALVVGGGGRVDRLTGSDWLRRGGAGGGGGLAVFVGGAGEDDLAVGLGFAAGGAGVVWDEAGSASRKSSSEPQMEKRKCGRTRCCRFRWRPMNRDPRPFHCGGRMRKRFMNRGLSAFSACSSTACSSLLDERRGRSQQRGAGERLRRGPRLRRRRR